MNPPSRRVLGQKDSNAHLNTRSPSKTMSTTVGTPAKNAASRKTSIMTSSSSPLAGTKRKIQEVEEAERVDPIPDEDSQQTQLLSDTESDNTRDEPSMSKQQLSYETANTSLPASQIAIEPQFELQQDEMSQRTLERLNDVPLPQNTSQLPPTQPLLLKEMSAGSVGLSNFFHFEGPPSTQNSDQPDVAEIQPKRAGLLNKAQAQDSTIDPATARKKMLEEKAEQLRTRLQLAMFKVQTKQTNQPFSRLKYPKATNRDRSSSPPVFSVPRLSTPTLSSSTIKQPSSARTIGPQHEHVRSVNSAEEHIAAMRAQAANQQKPAVRKLDSIPIPRLDPQLVNPTDSFATQMIDNESQHFPSSPPLSRQSSNLSADLPIIDPEMQAGPIPNTQLSSPPVSESSLAPKDTSSLAVMASIAIATQGEAASELVNVMNGE